MAKLKMLKIGVYGLQSDRKKVLEKMQRLGVVEIENVKADEDKIKLNTSQQLESFAHTIETFEKDRFWIDSKALRVTIGDGDIPVTYEQMEALIDHLNEHTQINRSIHFDDIVKKYRPW